jgi:hypothetical protein
MAGSERETHAAETAVFRVIYETRKLMETTKKGTLAHMQVSNKGK